MHTSAMYIGGMTVVAPIPIPEMNLEAYSPERLPPLSPCPSTPAIYMIVAKVKAHRRPNRSVIGRH